MGARSGVLALTLVVRDEEDILAANLDYHLAQGVDIVLAIDHGSSDRTPDILKDYEQSGRIRSFRDDDRPHDQVQRVNRLLRIAADEHRADWVIHCDADEFWMPTAGSLRDVFAAVPERYGYLEVERNNFVPVMDDSQPFHQRMIVRERRSLNVRGVGLEPKVAQRPAAAQSVTPGNHSLEAPVMPPAPDIGAIEVFHFPIRNFEQFERKVLKTGIGYELLQDRGPGTGCDQLELLEMHRQGRLRDYYDAAAVDPSRIHGGEAGGQLHEGEPSGPLVIDHRLQRFLADPPVRVDESPALQELLHRAWLRAGSTAEALAAAHSRLEMVDAELANVRLRAAELGRVLETIRASKIMRASAPVRRLYYRLRPGG